MKRLFDSEVVMLRRKTKRPLTKTELLLFVLPLLVVVGLLAWNLNHEWLSKKGVVPRLTLKHDHYVTAITFSRDGRFLVSGERAARQEIKNRNFAPVSVYLWDVKTGHLVSKFGDVRRWITDVAISPDKRLVAARDVALRGDAITVWNVQSGQVLWQAKADLYYGLSFSSDSKKLIHVAPDGIIIRDSLTGKPQRHLVLYRKGKIISDMDKATFSGDANLVAATIRTSQPMSNPQEFDYELFLWQLPSGKLLHRFAVRTGYQLAFSKMNERLFAAGGIAGWKLAYGTEPKNVQGQIALFGTKSGKRLWAHFLSTDPDSVAFSPDGRRLATDESSSTIVRDARTGTLVRSFTRREPFYRDGDILTQRTLAFSPDGKTLASRGYKTIQL
jgi:WD40 repeat protein